MPRKQSKEQQLYNRLRAHNIIMTETESNPTVYAFHRQRGEEIRAELVELHEKLAVRKPVPESVARARNARWRHYGALGQLRMAQICVRGITGLETATSEARDLASGIGQRLDKLIWLMRERNS